MELGYENAMFNSNPRSEDSSCDTCNYHNKIINSNVGKFFKDKEGVKYFYAGLFQDDRLSYHVLYDSISRKFEFVLLDELYKFE